MARNKGRVGGSREWATAVHAYDHQKEALKTRGPAGSRSRGQSVVPNFRDDEDRYRWELARWRTGTFVKAGKTGSSGWQGSDGLTYVGPPIMPGAPVFEHEDCKVAFAQANQSGYYGARDLARGAPFRINKYEMKKVLRANCHRLNIAHVKYAHRENTKVIWLCMFVHKDENQRIYDEFEDFAKVTHRAMSAGLVRFKQEMVKNLGMVK
jgi:hypothetical protein